MELNVYDDCWQLVQYFRRLSEKVEHCQFDLFCRCWQELQMQHIYSAQTNHIEVIATTLAAMHVGKRVACNRRSNGQAFSAHRAERFAGIYLLYVIYNKQPTQHFAKIEVSSNTWDTLTSYVMELKNEQTPRKDTQQVCYIFWHLCQHGAFRFTGLDYCQGLDNLIAYDHLESIVGSKNGKQHSKVVIRQQMRPAQGHGSIREDLTEFRELQEAAEPLCQLEAAYNKHKIELGKQDTVALPSTRIFSQLLETFNEIGQLLGDNQEQPSSSTTSSLTEQGQLRQQVRHKAMYGTEITKNDSQIDNMEDSEPGSNQSAQRRMSSATIFVRQLPMEVTKEYQRGDNSEDEEEDSDNEEH